MLCGLGLLSGRAVWPLSLALYRPRGLAAHCSAIVRAELRALVCGACSEMAGPWCPLTVSTHH